ncbi:GATA zinc finger domain-containing protein 14-like [Nasonia vitripennis]|uniref:Uncharacterized protein n=1 Tax=Nasonia vitripennis TaxID=7425 RepID=A0A7M7QQ51_NASVI|nr:GATA zinc finger domain-containing protein 14-like [Nasonia vitripennis]
MNNCSRIVFPTWKDLVDSDDTEVESQSSQKLQKNALKNVSRQVMLQSTERTKALFRHRQFMDQRSKLTLDNTNDNSKESTISKLGNVSVIVDKLPDHVLTSNRKRLAEEFEDSETSGDKCKGKTPPKKPEIALQQSKENKKSNDKSQPKNTENENESLNSDNCNEQFVNHNNSQALRIGNKLIANTNKNKGNKNDAPNESNSQEIPPVNDNEQNIRPNCHENENAENNEQHGNNSPHQVPGIENLDDHIGNNEQRNANADEGINDGIDGDPGTDSAGGIDESSTDSDECSEDENYTFDEMINDHEWGHIRKYKYKLFKYLRRLPPRPVVDDESYS